MRNVLVRFKPARHIEDFHHRGTEFSESYNFMEITRPLDSWRIKENMEQSNAQHEDCKGRNVLTPPHVRAVGELLFKLYTYIGRRGRFQTCQLYK